MTPVAIIQKLLQVNPTVAKFILAGLGVLAAASLAVTWIGGNPQALYLAGYILGLAFLATIIAFVANNRWMCLVLGWAVTGTFIAFLVGLVDSAVGLSGRLPTPACYVRIIFEAPQTCEQRLIPSIEITSLDAPDASPWHWQIAAVRSDARLWRAQADAGTQPRATPYDKGPIALQVAADVPTESAIALSQTLASLGWPVADGDMGGEKVTKHPDQNEVRFFDESAAEDAMALAHAIKAQRPDARIVVRDFSHSGLIAPSGLLEIWLNE
ncbi:MAG: hypothetical protein WBN04_08940 [Paracoccaceae bacterium]